MEQKLKQRLAGAIVLVALAVIFVPIILKGPDEDWAPGRDTMPEPPRMDYGVDMELPLPPAESGALEEAELAPTPAPEPAPARQADAVAPETPPRAAPQPEPVAAAPARQPEPAPAKPAPATAAPPPAAPPAPAAKSSAPSPVPPAGWYIQVGSFSQRMNAEGLRDRLQAAGHGTQIQALNIGKAQVYRVLVGPSGDRSAAEQLNSRLEKQQQLKGIVIEYPG